MDEHMLDSLADAVSRCLTVRSPAPHSISKDDVKEAAQHIARDLADRWPLNDHTTVAVARVPRTAWHVSLDDGHGARSYAFMARGVTLGADAYTVYAAYDAARNELWIRQEELPR